MGWQRGLFGGLPPLLLKDLSFNILKFSTFDIVRDTTFGLAPNLQEGLLSSLLVSLFSGTVVSQLAISASNMSAQARLVPHLNLPPPPLSLFL